MISEEKCYVGTCDNCQSLFDDGEFSLFVEASTVEERMCDNGWYVGYDEDENEGKHYCPNCYKNHPEEDDKIIVDLTRTKPQ